ncbi:MAG: hypothetical protein JRJ59_03690 [Deltaproteobacteria bacterium]|nr:hypothetical protein [Deltaproteobacteria bacterium]
MIEALSVNYFVSFFREFPYTTAIICAASFCLGALTCSLAVHLKKRWAGRARSVKPDLHETEEMSLVEDHEPSIDSPEESITPDAWHLSDVPPERKSVRAVVQDQEEPKVRK